MLKTILKMTALFVALYLLFVGWLYWAQSSLMYHPDTNRPDITAAPDGMVQIRIETTDLLNLYGWYKPPREAGMPVIVMYHGNAGNLEIRPKKISGFLDRGWGVLLAEYRGFGGNPGQPSEAGLYKDAHGFMSWILTQKSGRAGPVFVYGESMGTAVALEMALHYNLAGVMLEVPFSSIYDIAAGRYFYVPFLEKLMKDKFDNIEKLSDIDEDILIGTGVLDLVVPYDSAQKLHDAVRRNMQGRNQIITYNKGSHFNLHDLGWGDEMTGFVEKRI